MVACASLCTSSFLSSMERGSVAVCLYGVGGRGYARGRIDEWRARAGDSLAFVRLPAAPSALRERERVAIVRALVSSPPVGDVFVSGASSLLCL